MGRKLKNVASSSWSGFKLPDRIRAAAGALRLIVSIILGLSFVTIQGRAWDDECRSVRRSSLQAAATEGFTILAGSTTQSNVGSFTKPRFLRR